MAIIINNISIIYKVGAICLNEDWSCDITLYSGYNNLNTFVKTGKKIIHVSTDDVAIVLAEAPNGTTRQDDIGTAIYKYLIDKGHIVGELI